MRKHGLQMAMTALALSAMGGHHPNALLNERKEPEDVPEDTPEQIAAEGRQFAKDRFRSNLMSYQTVLVKHHAAQNGISVEAFKAAYPTGKNTGELSALALLHCFGLRWRVDETMDGYAVSLLPTAKADFALGWRDAKNASLTDLAQKLGVSAPSNKAALWDVFNKLNMSFRVISSQPVIEFYREEK